MDMALQSVPVPNLAKERADRTRTLRRFRIGDNTFRIMTQCSAIAVLVLLAGVMSVSGDWLASRLESLRVRLLHLGKLESGHREVRRARPPFTAR